MRKNSDNFRFRSLRVEELERREMLDAASWYMTTPLGAMTAEETEMWDLVNRIRIDPLGEYSHFFGYNNSGELAALDPRVDSAIRNWVSVQGKDYTVFMEDLKSEWLALSAADPLAVSAILNETAASHTQKMEAVGTMSHQYDGEASVADRIKTAFENSSVWSLADIAPSENITCQGQKPGTSGYSVVSYLVAAFMVEWGKEDTAPHRDNIMSDSFTEIGVSMKEVSSSKTALYPWIVTCDFATTTLGAASDGAYLLGSIYNDANSDGFYTAGEGLGGVTITIKNNASGETVELTRTAGNGLTAAGGYQIYLDSGSYTVTVNGAEDSPFSGGYSRIVTIGGDNVKLDFRAQDVNNTGPTIDLDPEDASGNGARVTFIEGGLGLLLTSKAQIGDDAQLRRIDIAFAERLDGDIEKLTATPVGNLRVSYNIESGSLTIYGSGTVAEFQSVLESLTYENDAEFCTPDARYIYVTVYDHLLQSASATVEIAMELTNLPTITVSDVAVWEGNDDGGSRIMTFEFLLDFAARVDVEFTYSTLDGTAVSGTDYVAGSGTGKVTIPQGERKASVEIHVLGNYDPEENKDFSLVIDPDSIVGALSDGETLTALGTIKDDDTPQSLGTIASWSTQTVKSFEFGEHQYLYSFTPAENGLVQWRADGSGAMQIAAYIGAHGEGTTANTSLALSTLSETGQSVEWYAEKGVVYVVMLTGPYSYRNPSLSLTELVAQDGAAELLVDNLLDADGTLTVQFDENGLTLGAGADQQFLSIADIAKMKIDSIRLKVDRENAALFFALIAGQEGLYNTAYDSFTVGGIDFYLDEFDSIRFGGGLRSKLELTGGAGNDRLVYGSGGGTFTVNVGEKNEKVYTFDDLSKIAITGGSGGDDVAILQDSSSVDSVQFTSGLIELSGGGHLISVSDFTTVQFASVCGGKDSLVIDGENISNLLLQTGYALMTGVSETNRAYSYTATGLSSIKADAGGCVNQITVVGENAGSVDYWTTFGYLRAVNARTKSSVVVTQALNLKIGGLTEEYADKLNFLETASDEYNIVEQPDGEIVLTETSTSGVRTITLPIWPQSLKPEEETPAALTSFLDDVLVETEIGDTASSATEELLAAAIAVTAPKAAALLTATALQSVSAEIDKSAVSSDDNFESWAIDALPQTDTFLWNGTENGLRRKKRGFLF